MIEENESVLKSVSPIARAIDEMSVADFVRLMVTLGNANPNSPTDLPVCIDPIVIGFND